MFCFLSEIMMVAWVLFIGTTASRRSLVFSRSCAKCNAAVKAICCKQRVDAKREADEERKRLMSDRNDLKQRLTKAKQELVDTKEQCIWSPCACTAVFNTTWTSVAIRARSRRKRNKKRSPPLCALFTKGLKTCSYYFKGAFTLLLVLPSNLLKVANDKIQNDSQIIQRMFANNS